MDIFEKTRNGIVQHGPMPDGRETFDQRVHVTPKKERRTSKRPRIDWGELGHPTMTMILGVAATSACGTRSIQTATGLALIRTDQERVYD
jgi:hypothetical protein